MSLIDRPGAALALALVVGACSDDAVAGGADDRPSVVTTTNILGDVVAAVAGDVADVTTIMPVGANPHDFQASAQEAAAMRQADLLVVNGAGFERGLLDVIEGAEADGVPVHEAISAVETLHLGDHRHDHAEDRATVDADDGHDHGDEDAQGHGSGGAGHSDAGVDPHFFTDPVRMAAAVEGIVDALVAEVPAIDEEALRTSAHEYLTELEQLDADIEAAFARIDVDNRVLLTNHEVFGYLADRYGFELVGTVIPGGSTSEGASAADLAALVDEIDEHDVPAIFADTSAPADLAQVLADEVGDVAVVELFSESLGEEGSAGATYLEMMRTNAERIVSALS